MAVSEVTFNVLSYRRPVVLSAEELEGLCTARVTHCRGVMVVLEELKAEFIRIGDVEATFVG